MRIRSKKPEKSEGLNIPLANWSLALASFLLGIIVPPIYERLTFDPISVSESSDFILQNGSCKFTRHSRLSIINTSKQSMAIEDITIENPLPEKFRFTSKLQTPTWGNKQTSQDDLPILLPADARQQFDFFIAFQFLPQPNTGVADSEFETEECYKQLKPYESMALNSQTLLIKVNGKYRKLKIDAMKFDRIK